MTDKAAPASEVNEEETDFEDEFTKLADEKDGILKDELDEDLEDDLKEPGDKLKNQENELDDDPDEKLKKEKEDKALDGLSDEDKAIYADLPDAAKERMLAMRTENENLNHRLDSDTGRVSAFQRKINVLEKEIQGIRKGGTAGEDQPSKTQIAEAMGGTDDEWDSFKKDYPEVAKAIDSRLDKAGQATQESVDNTLAPVKEKQQKDEIEKQEAASKAATDTVTETYPEWVEAVKKPDFAQWLEAQPPGIQSLSDSDDAKDASALIGLYDSHLVAEGKPTLKADPVDNGVDTKEAEEQQKKEAEAESLTKRRKQQLADGATIPSKNSRVDSRSEPVDDFEAAFNYHANRKERRRA